MDTTEKVKSRWTRSFFTTLNTRGGEERYVCDICQKDYASPANLDLHSQVHVIERKFKCEPCQVSFHSQGHLQKHKRSSAHETRVEMTQVFGIPTSDNPRPYGCPECDTAFRKHGHLAKHLRSKSHITKLEANGLIPVGTYAALDKCGQDLKDKLVTTNCEQSLHSLRQIAMHLFHPGQPVPEDLAGDHPAPLATDPLALAGALGHAEGHGYPLTSSSAMPAHHHNNNRHSNHHAHNHLHDHHLHQNHQPPMPGAPLFAAPVRSSPPQPVHLHHQHPEAPISLAPAVTMPSSNALMSHCHPPPMPAAPVSQGLHNLHPAHTNSATSMSLAAGFDGAHGRASQMMSMMNMMPHLTAQAQSLDYTLAPSGSQPPEHAAKGAAPMSEPLYTQPRQSDLLDNKLTLQGYEAPYQQQHGHHLQHNHLQQQHQQLHPHLHHPHLPATTFAGYVPTNGQQVPISMAPPTMSGGPGCPTTNGTSAYMRH